MLKIVKSSEIDAVIGTEIGVSDWVTIDQDRIDKFADATTVSYTHLTLPTKA